MPCNERDILVQAVVDEQEKVSAAKKLCTVAKRTNGDLEAALVALSEARRIKYAASMLVRPSVDTSKPANGAEPGQGICTVPRPVLTNIFRERQNWAHTDGTWAEGMATQGCDRSANSAAEMKGGAHPPSSSILA
jgi:hypothetical protein